MQGRQKLRKRNGAPNGKIVIIEWNSVAEEALEKLKQILVGELVLALPDYDKTFILSTDASDNGYGAVLEQNFKNSLEDPDQIKPIEYYSKSYTTAQKKYSTIIYNFILKWSRQGSRRSRSQQDTRRFHGSL